ncbi:MAG: hypothetical protein U1A78_28480 [Polyangia bacterium]
MPNEAEISSFDSNSRSLCPDDLCLGLVGADGRCNVCGRTGTPPDATSAAPTDGEPTGGEPTDGEPTSPVSSAGGAEAGPSSDGDADPDFADRRLCPDESCIGVLGDDGRCRECGKAA